MQYPDDVLRVYRFSRTERYRVQNSRDRRHSSRLLQHVCFGGLQRKVAEIRRGKAVDVLLEGNRLEDFLLVHVGSAATLLP